MALSSEFLEKLEELFPEYGQAQISICVGVSDNLICEFHLELNKDFFILAPIKPSYPQEPPPPVPPRPRPHYSEGEDKPPPVPPRNRSSHTLPRSSQRRNSERDPHMSLDLDHPDQLKTYHRHKSTKSNAPPQLASRRHHNNVVPPLESLNYSSSPSCTSPYALSCPNDESSATPAPPPKTYNRINHSRIQSS